MSSRSIGVDPFIRLYQMEEKARDMYDEYEKKVNDEELKAIFHMIKLQEEGHMVIARELIKLVQ